MATRLINIASPFSLIEVVIFTPPPVKALKYSASSKGVPLPKGDRKGREGPLAMKRGQAGPGPHNVGLIRYIFSLDEITSKDEFGKCRGADGGPVMLNI